MYYSALLYIINGQPTDFLPSSYITSLTSSFEIMVKMVIIILIRQ